MNDIYSPHTGEHIQTNDPAPWMGRAGVEAPEYDRVTQGCFWRGDAWEVVDAQPEPEIVIPQSVTRAQGKAALIQAGLWSAVVNYVESITDETKRLLAETALYDAATYERDSP